MKKKKQTVEMPMEFKVQGYKMDGDKAVGIIVNGGFVLQFNDEHGKPIPLNMESINKFLNGR